MPGDILVTPAQFCSSVPPIPSESHINPGLNYFFNNTDPTNYGYQAGAVVTVKIVHVPSGQVIFDKDVVVV